MLFTQAMPKEPVPPVRKSENDKVGSDIIAVRACFKVVDIANLSQIQIAHPIHFGPLRIAEGVTKVS